MKFLATTFVLLSSTLALAYPALNDQATYVGTYASGPNTTPFTMELDLIQYDAPNQQYLKRQIVTFGTATQTKDEWVKVSQLLSPVTVNQILANCASQGGTPDTVIINGSEAIKACALPVSNEDEDSIYWIADVPFGIAKAQMNNRKDAAQTNLTMQSHK